MTGDPAMLRKDWAGNISAYAIAWGLPIFAVLAGSFADVPARTAIWSFSLAWMGTACLMNARRCGRTHCRYTGPIYLLLIIPVLLQGLEIISLGQYAWYVLGAMILLGGKVIWLATETVWGKYSDP